MKILAPDCYYHQQDYVLMVTVIEACRRCSSAQYKLTTHRYHNRQFAGDEQHVQ